MASVHAMRRYTESMTAPAAPTIRVRSNGGSLRVSWQPVPNATDYKLYVGATTNPSGLEADIPDDDMSPSGWFDWTFVPDDAVSYIAVTALNVGAEESVHSNEIRVALSDGGRSFGPAARPKAPGNTVDPFGAY